MRKLVRVAFTCIAAGVMAASVGAQDGVEGTTIRPTQDKAKVEGCKIAKPGDYYFNVHNAAFGPGAIRGQLAKASHK